MKITLNMKLTLQLILFAGIVQGSFAWYGYPYAGHGDHDDDHDDEMDDMDDMDPQVCGDELDYKMGVIHSEAFPAGDKNTNECAWMKNYKNSSKVCYDICFYYYEKKVWEKMVCIDVESQSECSGDVHLSAMDCDGNNLGHINITDYGISGLAAPYAAYKIEYKCTGDKDDHKCEDSDEKYCKKTKKECKKNKDVQEKCPMTCNMCDEHDDGDDGMDKCEDSDAKYCKKNKKQCKKNKDVQEKCPMTCDMCDEHDDGDDHGDDHECEDSNYCKKNKKQCKKNKDVQEKCPKTCDMCDDHHDTTKGPYYGYEH